MADQRISESDFILNRDGSAFHVGLRPDQVPGKIITVGDQNRVEKVSRYFDQVDFKINNREFVSHKGIFRGKEILVISTGIGTDNVEIVMTELDGLVNIDFSTRLVMENPKELEIVRIGTSGSLQGDIPVGSELVSIYGVGFDNLLSYYQRASSEFELTISKKIQKSTGISFCPYMAKCSPRLSERIGFDMIAGNTATCPGFYAPQGRLVRARMSYQNLLDDLNRFRVGDFRLTNFEMETSALYALGALMGHEMLSVNAILVNRQTNTIANDPEVMIDNLIKKVLERI